MAASTNGIGIELVPGTLNYIQAYNRGTSDYGDLKIDAQTIRFGLDNGAEAARFDSDGRLAIGNTTTAADADIPDNIKLVVAGGVIVGSAAGNDNSFLGYRDIGGLTVLQGSGNYGLRIFDDNSTTPRFQVNRSGNVGIGTASPIEKLDVSGYQGISVNANYAHMGSTVSGAMAIFGHNIKSDSGNNIIKSANNGYHSSMIKMYYNEGITFHATAGTQSAGADFYNISGTTNELMRLTNDGKVGIGTTAPSSKLHVKHGDIRLEGNAESGQDITFTITNDNSGNEVEAGLIRFIDTGGGQSG